MDLKKVFLIVVIYAYFLLVFAIDVAIIVALGLAIFMG